MSEPDVVAELDRFIAEWHGPGSAGHPLQRARDEIVALRESFDNLLWLKTKIAATVRAEALEEAASICENLRPYAGANGNHHYLACACAIRALKDKP